MEPENDLSGTPQDHAPATEFANPSLPQPGEHGAEHGLLWIFAGEGGLRGGWSILVFVTLFVLFSFVVGTAFVSMRLVGDHPGFSPRSSFFSELIPLLALLGAAWLVAAIEQRNVLDFNLRGPHGVLDFCSGIAAGLLALSTLIGGLALGGWLHFGPVALGGAAIVKYGAAWAAAFLLVGCVEEGIFRCYLQFTLTRSVNFWWALGLVAAMCLRLAFSVRGNGAWGVYAIALLGAAPCLLLELKHAAGAAFWQAAWVTSTAFGFIHTGNNGENWVGIFAAAGIGFVFCVSVRLTGTAWWAIACHGAWDWAETYFYGASDSGNVAHGHLLTTIPAGNALWSGGTDGPEGSVLALGVVLLLLIAIVAIDGRRGRGVDAPEAAPAS